LKDFLIEFARGIAAEQQADFGPRGAIATKSENTRTLRSSSKQQQRSESPTSSDLKSQQINRSTGRINVNCWSRSDNLRCANESGQPGQLELPRIGERSKVPLELKNKWRPSPSQR
jgi:hypothetical protein